MLPCIKGPIHNVLTIRSLFPFKMRCTIVSLLLWVASAFRLDDGTLQKEKDLTELRTLERGQREASGKYCQTLTKGEKHRYQIYPIHNS